MIEAIKGKLVQKDQNRALLAVGPVEVGVMINSRTFAKLPAEGEEVKLFTSLYWREDKLALYGFYDEKSRVLFNMLKNVSGIGPKTALNILAADEADRVIAAIIERRSDFLAKTPGIGRKTAERVILELHNKLILSDSQGITETMDADRDLEATLVSLGYNRQEVRAVLTRLDPEIKKMEDRLRQALKFLSKI